MLTFLTTVLAFGSILAPLEVYQPSVPSDPDSYMTMEQWNDLTAPMEVSVPVPDVAPSESATTTPQEVEQTSPVEATPPPETPSTTPPSTESTGSRWDVLAECESNGEWDYGPHSGWGSGIYHGGLQFHPDTWTSFDTDGFAQYAYQATREQQIIVAERVLEAQGWGAWPACTRKLGWR